MLALAATLRPSDQLLDTESWQGSIMPALAAKTSPCAKVSSALRMGPLSQGEGCAGLHTSRYFHQHPAGMLLWLKVEGGDGGVLPSVEGDAAVVCTGNAKARQPPWPEQERSIRPGLKVRWRRGWLYLPLHIAALPRGPPANSRVQACA